MFCLSETLINARRIGSLIALHWPGKETAQYTPVTVLFAEKVP